MIGPLSSSDIVIIPTIVSLASVVSAIDNSIVYWPVIRLVTIIGLSPTMVIGWRYVQLVYIHVMVILILLNVPDNSHDIWIALTIRLCEVILHITMPLRTKSGKYYVGSYTVRVVNFKGFKFSWISWLLAIHKNKPWYHTHKSFMLCLSTKI